jgi:hypothetical protein
MAIHHHHIRRAGGEGGAGATNMTLPMHLASNIWDVPMKMLLNCGDEGIDELKSVFIYRQFVFVEQMTR